MLGQTSGPERSLYEVVTPPPHKIDVKMGILEMQLIRAATNQDIIGKIVTLVFKPRSIGTI